MMECRRHGSNGRKKSSLGRREYYVGCLKMCVLNQGVLQRVCVEKVVCVNTHILCVVCLAGVFWCVLK